MSEHNINEKTTIEVTVPESTAEDSAMIVPSVDKQCVDQVAESSAEDLGTIPIVDAVVTNWEDSNERVREATLADTPKKDRSKHKKELYKFEKTVKEKTNKDLEICKNRFNRSFHLIISEHDYKKDEVKRLQEEIERFEMSLKQTRRILKKRQREIMNEKDNIDYLKKKEQIINKERERRNAIVEKEKYAEICRTNLVENFKVGLEVTDEYTDDEIIKTAHQKTLERLFVWYIPSEEYDKYEIWEEREDCIYFDKAHRLVFSYSDVCSYNKGFSIYTSDDDIKGDPRFIVLPD